MPNFGIIALTSPSFPENIHDPAIVLAAGRAGGIGVLDVEFERPGQVIVPALERLLNGGNACGIKCGIKQLEDLKPALSLLGRAGAAVPAAPGQTAERLPERNVVILSLLQGGASSLKPAVELLRAYDLGVFVEAISASEAVLAQAAGADAVIAKGQESGGRIGEETAFVLLQSCLGQVKIPVWVQGGIGLHTAAACYVAGAAGVVLDNQLLLTRESPLPLIAANKISRLDGSETCCLKGAVPESYRVHCRKGQPLLIDDLQERIANHSGGADGWREALAAELEAAFARKSVNERVWALGQDAAFAGTLARKYRTVSGIIEAIRESVESHAAQARQLRPLAEGSALAQSHKTRYPIVQGAMTRVSDTAEFACQVAEGGALPFLALALMRGREIEELLAATKEKLNGRSWGVGILGFVPDQLRKEQMEVIRKYKPSFALIAGGRPDQAANLEEIGTTTYLHIPSPLLLKSFMEMGSRHFIFEGRECGGHVGPRSSFVLWELMIEVLLSSISPRDDASAFHVLFAGGIHDHLSSAMVAAMAAPLCARGVRVGVLIGTAYLFTKEAVESGAIVPKFQEEALKCSNTVLLETGPGHAIRCLSSPYQDTFEDVRKELIEKNKSREEVREELELMNLGRLRIASKGLSRAKEVISASAVSETLSTLETLPADKQWSEGMYMIGQVAALRSEICTIAQLHDEVSAAATEYLAKFEPATGQAISHFSVNKMDEMAADFAGSPLTASGLSVTSRQPAEGIAIIGMSCLFPQASDLESYWQNILNKADTITEIPLDQWEWRNYYDKDPLARDKIVSKWGGFLDAVPFDPTRYGIPPSSLASIDPMQLLILETARAALTDAGYEGRQFPRQNTSIILANAGHGPITALYSLRSMLGWKLADLDEEAKRHLQEALPEWTEDSFPGYLGNVTAGRVANRFDLGGINFSIDAACASSLAALYVAVGELRSGASDVVLLAAADTHNQPGDYLSFSKTHALSPGGRCRTFDATADGIAISEGMAVLVLKRLSDAEADGDRVYAVIRGIGGSSDGKDLSLTAPRPAGQMLALRRAYENAQVSPATVELVEAHGTGTVAGDKAEIEALRQVFALSGAQRGSCAVGSVKTNIGHSKAAAGLASLIKVAKALHHKVLPATIGVKVPNPACDFDSSPFYINSETRPWMHFRRDIPRRAGVSAFGFGGTNFHAVLEEYAAAPDKTITAAWPSELFLFAALSRKDLVKNLEAFEDQVRKSDAPLSRLAYSAYLRFADRSGSEVTLGLVASGAEDLKEKLARAKQLLKDESHSSLRDPKGIYFADKPLTPGAKLAFLFPGQGSQQVNMLSDLSLHFPQVRQKLENADRLLLEPLDSPLSSFIYPAPAFTETEANRQLKEITDTKIAQPAVGAADLAVLDLLRTFGLAPDMVAGHSYGEYVALCAAGAMSEESLLILSAKRGSILSDPALPAGSMAAVAAEAQVVAGIIGNLADVTIANINGPRQCIISGGRDSVKAALEVLAASKISAKPIAVSAAFHSSYMTEARSNLSNALDQVSFSPPSVPVYGNSDAGLYSQSPEDIRARLADHLVKPVMFLDEVRAMYEDGARIFVEVGPGSVLSNLVDSILSDSPHLSLSADRPGRNGLTQLQHLLANLAAEGVAVDIAPLFRERLQAIDECTGFEPWEEGRERKSRLSYLVNSSRIWREPVPTLPAQGKVNLPKAVEERAAAKSMAAPPQIELSKLNSEVKPGGPGVNGGNNGKKEASRVPVETKEDGGNGNGRGATLSGAPNKLSAPLPAAARSNIDQVVLHYQQTMLQMTNNFLQAQHDVMMAYLQSAGRGSSLKAASGALELSLPPVPTLLLETPGPAHHHAGQAAAADRDPQVAEAAPKSYLRPAEDLDVPAPSNEDSTKLPSQAAAPENIKDNEPSVKQLIAELLEIVSQRTGYPPEMLDPSLDLEADLGIDSIKRVEILSSFRKILPERILAQLEGGGIEKLAGIKTLQGIIDWIYSTEENPAAGAPATPQTASAIVASPKDREAGKVSRALIKVVKLSSVATFPSVLDGQVVIVDDETGVAGQLALRLRQKGQPVVLLRHRTQEAVLPSLEKDVLPGSVYTADLSKPEAVAQITDSIKKAGSVSALIHLLGLNATGLPESGDKGLVVKSLFLLSKALVTDLTSNGKSGRALVLSATSFGGGFCVELAGENIELVDSTTAGTVGVIKSLAREWPEVRAKAVDFDRAQSPEIIAGHLLDEMFSDDGIVEVGYASGVRLGLEVVPAPLEALEDEGGEPLLNASSVVLITGGARGITAQIALELAEKYKPTLILVGRASRPEAAESRHTAGLESARELKSAIMERLRGEGQAVNVQAVENIYHKLMKEREIRSNLAQLERYGATVRYYAVDVRDEQAFARLVDGLYETFGKIDGVIHGAGVIEDAFLRDKQPESFNRVFETKVNSALTLSNSLRFDMLKFLLFFSSVVGRTGNAGQADYVAANEVLNKLAAKLNSLSRARVASLMWGPWRAGMAQPELESIFAQHGWSMIDPASGRRSFLNELLHGRKDEVEVLLVGQLADKDRGGSPPATAGPESYAPPVTARGARLHGAQVTSVRPGLVQFAIELDPAVDVYLNDHCFDGVPVLPMAVALEMMVEAAVSVYPEWKLSHVESLEIPAGVVIEGDKKQVNLLVEESLRNEETLEAKVSLTSGPRARSHFKATVVLTAPTKEVSYALPPAIDPFYSTSGFADPVSAPPTVPQVYDQWLFHGPLFQRVSSISAMGKNGIAGAVQFSVPDQALSTGQGAQWLIDPLLLDSALQLAGIWARHYFDITVLPAGFRKLQLLNDALKKGYLAGSTGCLWVRVFIPPETAEGELLCDLCLYDDKGRPVAVVEGLAGIGSRAFNRFAAQPAELRTV